MPDKNFILDFFNKNGYFIAVSQEAVKAAEELVAEGVLRSAEGLVDEEVHRKYSGLYVGAFVQCSQQMPVSLWKILVKVPLSKGEIVTVELAQKAGDGSSVEVFAEIDRKRDNGKWEVIVLGSRSCVFVSENQIRRLGPVAGLRR